MNIIKGKDFYLKNTCVTIGKFDGIHLGHRKLLTEMNKYADVLNTTVLSFDNSELNNVLERSNSLQLCSYEEKISLLDKYGIKNLILYPFDMETRDMRPEEFINEVLSKKLDAKIIIAGSNFRFGKNADGDISTLKYFSGKYNYSICEIECLRNNNRIISSTSIRNMIENGNYKDAAFLLDRDIYRL